jgi:hypothetical protein
MARAALNDPIFYTSKDHGVPEKEWDANENSLSWQTIMPDASDLMAKQTDPGLGLSYGGWPDLDALGGQVLNALGENPTPEAIAQVLLIGEQSQLMNEMTQMANLDTIRGLRGMVGTVATTVGFVRSTMTTDIKNIYNEPLQTVAAGVEVLSNVVNSKYFQKAMEGIAWIPIVGWIIAIVADLLTLIADIASHVRSKRIKEMNTALARRAHVPLMGDPDLAKAANQAGVRKILQYIEDWKLQGTFLPPVALPANGAVGFVKALAARDPDSDYDYVDENGDTIKLTAAWYLTGPPLGLGLQPGSLDLVRMIEFLAGHGGAVPQSTGRFMITARQMAAQLWQMVQNAGEPCLFAVDTHYVTEAWDNYVHGLLEYNEQCVMKGFTVDDAGYPCSTDHWCYEQNQFCRSRDVGKKVKWPGSVNHFAEFNQYLASTFWGRGPLQDRFPYDVRDTNKEWDPDNFHYQNTIYGMALRQLREQQSSYVGGYEAMLVHPGKEGNITPFPSLANDNGLKQKWGQTVTRILNDPSLWRNVNWRDVPEYTFWGESPREILKQKWQGQIQGTITTGGAPPVPGGPEDFPPPTPPALPGQKVHAVRAFLAGEPLPKKTPLPTPSKVMLGSAVAAGAVAGGIHLYNRYGRVFAK